MKKKLSSILMCMLILSLVISGCTKKPAADQEGTKQEATVSNEIPAGQLPVTKEKVNLKVFSIQTSRVTDYETNEYTKWLEEKTNVHIDWVLTPEKDAATKVNLLLASNSDLPDVFLRPALSSDLLVNYGQQGVFIPLNQYIDKFGVEVKKIQSIYPNLIKDITMPDGNVYSLFTKNESFNVQYRQRLWINQTFLTKLNLKMPKTTDELYSVLKAFKEKDPNGNGKADEIPMSGGNTGDTGKVDAFIMNAFVNNDVIRNRLSLKDGKVQASYDKPGWKEGVLYYKKLANEGLMDPLAFTQDGTQLKQLINDKTMTVGVIMSENSNQFAGAGSERIKDYVAVPPLKGPNGVQWAAHKPSNPGVGSFVITKACKYPEVAFRMADFMLSEEASLRARFGVPEKDWVKAAAGEVGANGEPAIVKPILKWGETQNSNWATAGFYYISAKIEAGQVVDKSNPFDFETVLYKAAKEQEPYGYKEPMTPVIYTPEESAEVATLRTQINTYVDETFAKMVLKKEVDVEKEWNGYLNELKKLGLEKYLEINQKAYDRQYKSKK